MLIWPKLNRILLMQNGFTLIELLIAVFIIGVLSAVAVPYYFNAAESARMTEAVVLWGRTKNFYKGRAMDEAHARRIELRAQKDNPLKYFTLHIMCRPETGKTYCWEAEFEQKETRHALYKLTTTDNFLHLACIGLNSAGEDFCQSRAAQETPVLVGGQSAFLIKF